MKEATDNIKTLIGFIENETVRGKLFQSESRIRKSFETLFSGYSLTAENVLNEVVTVDNHSGIIAVKEINFYSFCEHHFAPFFGTANVYYEPNKIITGLGKIVRLVHDVHARRLQIQEIMTRNIAEDIARVLDAKGVYVETRAKHLCVCSRGPSDDTAHTYCSYALGTFKNKIYNL